MLRSLSQQAQTLFSGNKNGHITIYIDHIIDEKYKPFTERVTEFHDKGQQCMHAVIESFCIEEAEQFSFQRKHLQATFHIKDLSGLELNIINKTKTPLENIDKEYLITKCAAESILRLLFAKKLINNEIIAFQAQRGNSITANFDIYTAKLHMVKKPKGDSCATNDLVATVNAKFTEHQIIIYFNYASSETIANVTEIFSKHFPLVEPRMSHRNE